MSPSLRKFALTGLATLAIGGVEGLKLQRRADPMDTSNLQGAQNILVTDADQTHFYVPMQFGSGNGVFDTYGLVSTTRGDIILPGVHANHTSGFVSQEKSVAEGPIYAGPVSAAGWTVPDQDIIFYYENSSAVLPIEAKGEVAYAGFSIWPNTSTILQALGDWSADSFMARVLAEPAAGPYWTLLINPLEEDKGNAGSFGGLLSIGEIVNVSQIFNITEDVLQQNNFPNLELVTQYPHLNNTGSYNNITYYAVIDAIKWGDVSATLNSTVPGTPQGKISAYIDSTYPWIQVPYTVTEQLYKNLENATYDNDTHLWYFQCTELNVNITIAGYDYPISPLTAVEHIDGLYCVGTFQAKPQDVGGDVILGVPFLKNVYASFGYETRSNNTVSDPYVQLMPVTNSVDAHDDWVTWYNNWSGNSTEPSSVSTPPQSTPGPSSLSTSPYLSSTPYPTPYSSTYPPSPPSSSPPPPSHSSYSSYSSPSSSPDPLATGGNNKITGAAEDDNEEKPDNVKRYLPAIIVGSVVGGLALIGGVIFAVMKMRNGKDGKGAYRGLGKADDGVGPVQVSLYDDQAPSGRYGDGGQGRYTDPYRDQ